MPAPEKYSFHDAVLWKGIACHITSRHGQPSKQFPDKWPRAGFYYNLREDKSGKLQYDIHHDDLVPVHIALEHDRDRLVAEKAD